MAVKKKPAAKKPVTKKKVKAVAPKKPAHPLKIDGKSFDKLKVMEIVCRTISTTNKGLAVILREGHGNFSLPNVSNVREWIQGDEKIRDLYTRAKEYQADLLVEEMIEIADKGGATPLVIDGELITDGMGQPVMATTAVSVNHARLMVDTRKWTASKLKAKRYGDKVQVGGADDLPPLQFTKIERVIVKPKP